MSESEVRVLKLQSGEEVIGKVDPTATEFLRDDVGLTDVFGLRYDFDPQNGQVRYTLVPYCPLSKGPFVFPPSHVTHESAPTDALLEYYNKLTGAIITPPTQQLVIP